MDEMVMCVNAPPVSKQQHMRRRVSPTRCLIHPAHMNYCCCFSCCFKSVCIVCLRRSVHTSGPGPREPARRSLHQREAAAEPHPTQDRGDGPPWHPALRHLATAAGFSRLRLQDSVPVPGDRLDPSRGHRREQAQGEWRSGRCGFG